MESNPKAYGYFVCGLIECICCNHVKLFTLACLQGSEVEGCPWDYEAIDDFYKGDLK